MNSTAYRIINGITIYRIAAAPVLLALVFHNEPEWFKWLLAISFFTDLIDGMLARIFKVTSIIGSYLDSIGDDLTVAVAIVAMFYFKFSFINNHVVIIIIPIVLFVLQFILAHLKYGKITSFHTYGAKLAAILQGIFLILAFFLDSPPVTFFYFAIIITILELIEEIIILFFLEKWETNVKGLYWVLKNKKSS